MTAFLIIGGLIVLLFAVLLIRTLLFRPGKEIPMEADTPAFDGDGAIDALSRLIRCKTVSYYDHALEDDREFQKLIDLLPELYPEVFRTCTFTQLPDRALLFCWKGKQSDAPAVMMAHYDVVPVEEANWEKPPFSGMVEDGVLWGRGSLDTKVTFNAVLFAANTLIGQGFVPEQDIYFAFSGGEEVNGPGALHIVDWFVEQGITPALVLDEGGAVVENVFPGLKVPCGLIGIAEKGMVNLTFSVESQGGHASAPKPHTPVGNLSRACCALEDHPFHMHLTVPAAKMFDTLGRRSNFLYRMIFANLWLFEGVLDMLARKSGGEMNALLRTTVAFTQAKGSAAPNVIPPSASMTANLRLNPADSLEGVMKRVRCIIGDDRITVTADNGMEPSPISETDCPAWDKVASAVANTWQGCVVSPYLMVQCSDSRHYRDLSRHVYRFSAMDLTAEERATIHGNNERIRLETVRRAVEFYLRLMRQC